MTGETGAESLSVNEDNKRIAGQIEKIVSEARGVRGGKGAQLGHSKTANFHHKHKPEMRIALGAWYSSFGLRFVPEGFTAPSYSFDYQPPEEEARFTTPHGIQPQRVIGADEQLYIFGATYYFSNSGQGLKEETIFSGGEMDPAREERFKAQGIEIPRISESALTGEKDILRRPVNLAYGDYELVQNVLSQIQRGDFEED